jgi:hypothetical protein
MAKNQSTTESAVSTVNGHAEATAGRARQAAAAAVDLPVGTALSLVDRVNEVTSPWRSRETATDELKNIRFQVNRELSKLERRGATTRRKAVKQVDDTRARVEREISDRRHRVEMTVKENRRKAEQNIRDARERIGV